MSEKTADPDELEDLKEFLSEKKEFKSEIMTIINDGRQFSVRIPKKFARMFELKGGEKFEFIPERHDDEWELVGRLKQNETED